MLTKKQVLVCERILQLQDKKEVMARDILPIIKTGSFSNVSAYLRQKGILERIGPHKPYKYRINQQEYAKELISPRKSRSKHDLGVYGKVDVVAKANGMSRQALYQKLRRGWKLVGGVLTRI